MHGPIFFVVLLGFAVAVHYFVALSLIDAIPSLRARKQAVVRVAMILCGLAPIGRIAGRVSHADLFVRLGAVGLTEWMIVLLGAVPLGLVRFVFFVVDRLLGARRALAREASRDDASTVTRREAVERVTSVLAFGASSAVLGWGMVRGRHAFVMEEVPVRMPGLPRTLDGYTIAQI
jgi:uncharacterized protein